MQATSDRGRFAERVLHGIDDAGEPETIVIWIERKAGALWAVGRAVNPELREVREPRPEDYVFEGYELADALDQANAALEDDLTVSEQDGRSEHLRPFTRDELLKPLEAWFFGR
ncbi:MAG TPA: hypothetical protein VJ986_07730 [Gaiellaceae bacterium]|nr:hypothetical protein [Gaiellaceae bacterium]